MTTKIENYLKGAENFILKNGYYFDVERNQYVQRVVMELKFGHPLWPWQEVHHKDRNKLNNDPRNLYVCSRWKHQFIHEWDLRTTGSW